MKLRFEYEAVDMGDEVVLVPIGEGAKKIGGVVKLNASALEIINLIETNPTEPDIVNALAAKYENGTDDLQGYVHGVLATLRANGLIEE